MSTKSNKSTKSSLILVSVLTSMFAGCAQIPQSTYNSPESNQVKPVSKYDTMIEDNHMTYEEFIQFLATSNQGV